MLVTNKTPPTSANISARPLMDPVELYDHHCLIDSRDARVVTPITESRWPWSLVIVILIALVCLSHQQVTCGPGIESSQQQVIESQARISPFVHAHGDLPMP